MNRVFVFFLIVILYSCGKRSVNDTNVDSITRIDLLTEPEYTINKLSEIATTVEYIPLQSSKSSLLNSFVLKIVGSNNKIFIQNSGFTHEILCFDKTGKFLFKLQNSGRGPEEYINITDFDVSADNTILILLSDLSHKILLYKISDSGFTFHRSLTLKDPVPMRIGLVPETDKTFLAIAPWRGSEPTLSITINNAGDTIHFKPNCYKYEMVRKNNYRSLGETQVYSVNNTVCFKEEFSDTVFYIDSKDNLFKPRIIFDSHGTLLTPRMRGGSEPTGDNTTFISNILETSRYVSYWYSRWDKQNDRILFDKRTNKKYKMHSENVIENIANVSVEIPKNKIKDDLAGGPDFTIRKDLWDCSESKLFSFIDAITLKKYVESQDFKNARVNDSKKTELKKLANSLTETDNPVLVIVTPKD